MEKAVLNIITGPAQSGKSKYIFNSIGQLAAAEEPSLLIVPESYSHQAERGLLSTCGNSVGRFAAVTTFSKLSRDILTSTGAGARFLEDSGRILYMHGALADTQSQLEYFKAVQKPRLVSKLLEAVDELAACRVTPGELLEAAAVDRLPPKIRDLAMIYAAFQARIERGGLDSRNPFDVACGLIHEISWLKGTHVFIDGFSGFTAQRRHAIGRMLGTCADVTVSLLLGEDPVLFAQQEKTKMQLINLAADNGVKCVLHGPPNANASPLDLLARGIFDYSVKDAKAAPSAVQIYGCGGPAEECRLVAALARQLLIRQDDVRARQIAVVCTDMSGYAAGLETEFSRFGVPIFISRAEDILSKPPIRAFVGALAAVEGGLGLENVIDWLKTGLSGIDSGSCNKLENYALTWNIRGERWLRPFTAHTTGFGNPVSDEADRLAEVEAIRRRALEPLEWLAREVKGCKLGLDFARVCRLHLEKTALAARLEERAAHLEEQGRPRLALQYVQIFDIIDGALEQFEGAMGAQEMTLRDFIRLMELTLGQYSVDTIPASLDAVQACTFERFPMGGIDYLFILGARDGLLPKQAKGAGLISESERIALENAGIVLTQTAEEMALEEQSYIYRAIAGAKQVVFTWPAAGAGGEKFTQSHLLRRVKALTAADEAAAGRVLPLLELTAKAPALEAACSAVSADEPRAAAAMEYLRREGAAPFFDNLISWARRPSGSISDPKLVLDMYGSVLPMTATRVEKIASCRFSYFMDYGLKAKKRKRAELGPPEIGTLVHDVVENAIRRFCQNSDSSIEAVVAACIEQGMKKLLNGKEITSRLKGLAEMITENIRHIVSNIWDEISNSAFKPLFFELSFDSKGDLPPLEIQAGDAKARIGGKIDRVDGWVDGETLYLKVVDYKTGEKAFKLSDVYYGLNLQMFLYLNMLRAEGVSKALGTAQEVLGAQPARLDFGGALYTPAKAPWVQASPEDLASSIQGSIDKELRRMGIVNSNKRVLEAMEPNTNGGFRFLPVSLKKDGGFSAYSSVASSDQLGSLMRHTQQMVRELAICIAAGDITANPYRKGWNFSACDWCDFRAACHFDPDSKIASYRYLPPLKDLEVFEKLEMTGEEAE